MNIVVLVPRRADKSRRDEVWKFVRNRWRTEHPEYRVVEGVHAGKQPFNRGLAINRAAAKAGDWDIAIIADADSFCAAEQIDAAVETCARTGQMTLAYDRFVYLTREMSDAVMAGSTGNWWSGVEWTMPGTCSSMVVVTRKVWDEAEGFDEGFDTGWGADDIAASHKFQTFGGGLQRIPGDVWHLWHSPAVHGDKSQWVPRMEMYAKASYDKKAMRALMKRLKAKP